MQAGKTRSLDMLRLTPKARSIVVLDGLLLELDDEARVAVGAKTDTVAIRLSQLYRVQESQEQEDPSDVKGARRQNTRRG